VYNPLNGAYMKSCANDIDSVVISLVYLGDNRTFLAGYVNGTMRLYDESKLDDCLTLRTFDAYNSHSELVMMTYCPVDRSVITTGAIGQPLKIWDFDTGKCDAEMEVCDDRETVVALQLLHPYPLIVTSDSIGNVIIWGSRGCKWKGDKIAGFVNLNPVEAEMEPQAKADANGIPPQRIMPPKSATSKRDFNLDDEEIDFQCSEDDYDDKVHSAMQDSIAKWGPLSAATAVSWDANTNTFYTGDELGHLRKWSLESVIEELGGMSMVHGAKAKPSTPKEIATLRRGNSCAMAPVSRGTTPFMLSKRDATNFMGVKFCWSLHGHDESIICCTATQHGVITSSTDNLVKMWTFDGLLVGVLLHSATSGIRSANWDLTIDIPAIREREEREVDSIMDEIMEIGKHDKNTVAADDKPVVLNSSDEAKFSRSSLRKRIEQSSRILGLDFTAEMYPSDDQSDCSSLVEDDDMSMASTTSKSTKNAIDEAKNIHRQPGLVAKKKSLNVAQLRRKDHTMQKMAEMYSEKGIKLPVLTTPARSKDFAPLASTTESYLDNQRTTGNAATGESLSLPPFSPSKQLKQPMARSDRAVHARKTVIANKCAKYNSFSALENSLLKSSGENISTEERAARRQTKIRHKEERRKESVKSNQALALASAELLAAVVEEKPNDDCNTVDNAKDM
jgi:WD40 repeat protein